MSSTPSPPRLPTEAVLTPTPTRYQVDLDDYKSEMASGLADAWTVARAHVKKAQRRQKTFHDRRAKDPEICVGDHLFIFMPSDKQGKAYKLARPFGALIVSLHCLRMALKLSLSTNREQ